MHAVLGVTTSGYMALTEGCVTSGLPMVLLFLLGVSTGNWWYMQAGMGRGECRAVGLQWVGGCLTCRQGWEV